MSESNRAGGIGFVGALGVAFVVLKLCNVIDWSWWWVTAPFWGPPALVVGVLVAVGLLVGLACVTAAVIVGVADFTAKLAAAKKRAADEERKKRS